MFRRRADLVNFKATMNPGIYVYPFRFQLDDNIPGSFVCSQTDFNGVIVYKLKAEVMRPGMFQTNIKNTQIVQVNTHLKHQISKVQMSKDANVTRLCCIDMGEVSLSAILDKNAYSPGETANLIISIDNTASDVTLKHVSFKLSNQVTMRANLYVKSFKESACKNQAPSIPKGDTAHISFALSIPPNLNPTTQGVLISSYYEMEIVLSVPCSKDVVIALPVTLFAPPPVDYIDQIQYPSERPPQYQQPIEINPNMFKIYWDNNKLNKKERKEKSF